MAKLIWGEAAERFFETGVDRGVLYVDNNGYAWNGIVSVSEAPTGGESRPAYLDGVKFRNIAASTEFEASLEALSAPSEFGPCDGTAAIHNGLFATQQPRRAFSLSYRTLVGNAVVGSELGYKIHLVYNALAAPAQKTNSTINESPEAGARSWSLTTLPPALTGMKPTAHFVIDSRTTPKGLLNAIEEILYGSEAAQARIPMVSELVELFQSEGPLLRINHNTNPAFRSSTGTLEVTRNYIKNPLFRAVSGVVVMRQNWATNPGAEGSSGWSSNNPDTWTASFDTTVKRSGTRSCKSVPVASGTSTGIMSVFNAGGSDIPCVVGTVMTGSFYFTSNANHKARIAYVFLDSSGAAMGSSTYSPYTDSIPGDINVWNRVSITTITIPSGAVKIRYIAEVARTDGNSTTSDVAYADDFLCETTNTLNPYFDGSTVNTSDLTHSWLGATGSSYSVVTGRALTGLSAGGNSALVQSTEWLRPNRTYSMRLASRYHLGTSGYADLATLVSGTPLLIPGKTYSVSGWFYSPPSKPNTAAAIMFVVSGAGGAKSTKVSPGGGEQFLSLTFTVPTDPAMTGAYLRLYNAHAQGDADIWISDLVLVEGPMAPSFFSGSSAPDRGLVYSWEGVVDASSSIATGLKPTNYGASITPAINGTSWNDPVEEIIYLSNRGSASYVLLSTPTTSPIGKDSLGVRVKTRVTANADTRIVTWAEFGTGIAGRIMAIYDLLENVPFDIDRVYLPNATPGSASTGRWYIGWHPPVPAPQTPVLLKIEPILIADTNDVGEYFDGSTPDENGYVYSWTGAADASTSQVNTWHLN